MSIFAYADVLNLFPKYCTKVMECPVYRICYDYSIIIFTDAEKCNTYILYSI